MHIVFCTNQMCDGGAERVVSLWIRGFRDRGDTASLVIGTKKNKIDYEIPSDVPIYNIFPGEINRLKAFCRRISSLRKLVIKEHPDLIITALSSWGLWAYLSTIGLKTRIINTEHNAFERPDSALMPKSTYFYKFYVNKLFNKVTVLTQADKEFIGHRLKHIFVLPNPLTFTPTPTLPPKKKIVLAAGRLDSWHVKGFDVLLKAWNQVAREHRDWKLIIAGSSSAKSLAFLHSLIDMDVASSVTFTGFTSNIESYYKEASIFAFSSRYDGFGMVLIEAMSQGCSCIAVDYKGRQREILGDSEYGLLCRGEDEEELANKIDYLIVNESRRRELQLAAIDRSKDYSLDSIMDKWDSILHS